MMIYRFITDSVSVIYTCNILATNSISTERREEEGRRVRRGEKKRGGAMRGEEEK